MSPRKMCIIVPCFNQVGVTTEFVRSVQENCTRGTYEFIFIDNGSCDRTAEFLSTVPDAEVITNKKNVYVNPAWNQGFHRFLQKDVPYCCLANNDIVVGKDWLTPIFESFETRKCEIYVPCSNMEPRKEFTDRTGFERYPERLAGRNKTYLSVHTGFPGWCLFMTREHVKVFYPIPESIKILRGDDWIMDHLYHEGVVPTRCSHCYAWHHESKTQRAMSLGGVHHEDVEDWGKILRMYYEPRRMKQVRERKPKVRMQ